MDPSKTEKPKALAAAGSEADPPPYYSDRNTLPDIDGDVPPDSEAAKLKKVINSRMEVFVKRITERAVSYVLNADNWHETTRMLKTYNRTSPICVSPYRACMFILWAERGHERMAMSEFKKEGFRVIQNPPGSELYTVAYSSGLADYCGTSELENVEFDDVVRYQRNELDLDDSYTAFLLEM